MTDPEPQPATPETLLDFEREHPREGAWKEYDIRMQFGIGYARYHQLLNRAAASEPGIRHDPATAARVTTGNTRSLRNLYERSTR